MGALIHAVQDALTDLAEAERRSELARQQISNGYVRERFERLER